jgi:predicted nucleic acid-binding protein
LAVLIDTGVAIHLIDGDERARARGNELGPVVALSAISLIELENGVHREPGWRDVRRAALDILLSRVVTLDFGGAEIAAYRAILEAAGYSRRKTLDRMIGATALVHDLSLATTNPSDFRDISGLDVIAWSPT